MEVGIQQISKKIRRVSLATSVFALALIIPVSAIVLSGGVSQGRDKLLLGNWRLSVSLNGDGISQPPAIVTFQEIGNKLSGKVTVQDVVATPTGPQPAGTVDMTLTDLKFNGKTLSFKVINGEDSLDGQLTKITDDLFEGHWKSPISGRWEGSKSEFTGNLIMTRVK
jgi:hypothetical protein